MACQLAFASKGLTVWHKTVVKAIGQNDVYRLVKQFQAFTCGNIAYGRETVYMMSGLLLNRVFRLHVKLIGHLVTIIGKQIVIERFLITGNRTAYTGSMGRKECCYLWNILVQVEGTQTAHPLIGMIDDLQG